MTGADVGTDGNGARLDTYDARAYGEHCAAFYDELYPPPGQRQLDVLAGLARGGAVLELGVGTGRVACALAARGLEVWGIESSPAMRARLAQRAGGEAIRLVAADMAQFELPRRFALVLSLVDTLALLPLQRQRAALRCASAHLLPQGIVLLESSCLDAPSPLPLTVSVDLPTAAGRRRYDTTVHPQDAQSMDAMARECGLELAARWQAWHGRVWNGGARGVSLYRGREPPD